MQLVSQDSALDRATFGWKNFKHDDDTSSRGESVPDNGLGHLLEAAGLAGSSSNTLRFLESGKQSNSSASSTDSSINLKGVNMTALTELESEPLLKKPRQDMFTAVGVRETLLADTPVVPPHPNVSNKRSTKHSLAAATAEMRDLSQGQAVWRPSLQEQIRRILEDQQRQLHLQIVAARSSNSSAIPASSSSVPETDSSPETTPPADGCDVTSQVRRQRQELGVSNTSYHHDNSHSPPPESSNDANETSTSLALRRRQAKREYSKAYRVQQKNQVSTLEVQLSQANMALQFLQNMHAQLQVKYTELVDSQHETQATRHGDTHFQELRSTVKQLRTENELLRTKLQEAQTDLAASHDSLVRKLLLKFGPINEAHTLEVPSRSRSRSRSRSPGTPKLLEGRSTHS